MPETHVCLISGQPIPNLLPLLIEKPEQVIFLVSQEMLPQAERLRKIAQPRGIRVSMQTIDAYDFEMVTEVCDGLVAEHHGNNTLTLNVTGGTKITALAAYQVFFANQRIIYCDTAHHRRLELAPKHREQPLTENLLGIRDYLTAYGIPPSNEGKPPSRAEIRRPHLTALAKLLIENDSLLARLNSSLNKEKQGYANITLNALGEGAENLAGLLGQCGVATLVSGNSLNIANKENMFFCAGGWLEEYTYEMVRRLGIKGLDLEMNVEVRWDGKGRQQTENEFDVLFTHRNQLHLVSCKASNPERQTASGSKFTEALNELDSLKDRAGGLFGRGMLVSARNLRDEDRERAKKMKIELVDGKEALRLGERLKAWLA